MAFPLAILSIALSPALPAKADTESIKQSVVHLQQQWSGTITAYGSNGMTYQDEVTPSGACTGFFVDTSGAIATAGHCVDPNATGDLFEGEYHNLLARSGNFTQAEMQYMLSTATVSGVSLDAVYAYQPNELNGVLDNDGIQVQVVNFQPLSQGDNALLRLNNFSQETPPLPIAQTRPSEQEQVTAVGFPGGVTFNTDSARQNASFKQGTVSSHQTSDGVPFTEVDAGMEKGMSGGPVLTSNEEVFGIVSWGLDATTMNFATDTGLLRSFLSSNGIDLAATAPAPADTTSSVIPVDDQTESAVQPAEASSGDSALLPWVITLGSLLALIVIAGIVGLIVYMRRKPKALGAPASPSVNSGQYIGQSLGQGKPGQPHGYGQPPSYGQPGQPNGPADPFGSSREAGPPYR